MNEVIETLCEKFNTTAETLIGTMTGYYPTFAVVTLLLASISAIVFIAVAVVLLINEYKKWLRSLFRYVQLAMWCWLPSTRTHTR